MKVYSVDLPIPSPNEIGYTAKVQIHVVIVYSVFPGMFLYYSCYQF